MILHDVRRGLVVACVLMPLFLEGKAHNDDGQDMANLAARLTVMALRASVDLNVAGEGRWLLLPEGSAITERDLIDHLARASKPLECAAQRAGSQITVQCQLPDMDGFVGVREGALESLKRVLATVSEGENLRLLIRGGGQRVVTDEQVFRVWVSTYAVVGAVKRWAGASVEGTQAGAQACLTLLPSTQFRVIADSSEDL